MGKLARNEFKKCRKHLFPHVLTITSFETFGKLFVLKELFCIVAGLELASKIKNDFHAGCSVGNFPYFFNKSLLSA